MRFIFGTKHCPQCGKRFEAYCRLMTLHNSLRSWHCSRFGTQLRFNRVQAALHEQFRDAELAELEARKAYDEARADAKSRLATDLRPGHQARIDRIRAALHEAAAVIERESDGEAADALLFDGRLPWESAVWAELDRRLPNSKINQWAHVLRGEGFRL